jgi:hypothetical protein
MDRRRFASAVLSLAVVVGSLVACTWWLSSLSHRDDTVLAASSPSAAVSADPSPSASLDGPPGSPVDAVTAFYDHLNAKDYQGAYALLSSAEQQRHPFAAFSADQSRIDETAFKITGSRLDTVTLIVGSTISMTLAICKRRPVRGPSLRAPIDAPGCSIPASLRHQPRCRLPRARPVRCRRSRRARAPDGLNRAAEAADMPCI